MLACAPAASAAEEADAVRAATAQELKAALDGDAEHVVITEHLDLTGPLLPTGLKAM